MIRKKFPGAYVEIIIIKTTTITNKKEGSKNERKRNPESITMNPNKK